ncbi:uncharacterized protein LOC128898245 [Dryobates pubescens]|uniref:uncharacterized protein LOC128898245 n=1 Tax=Dryobates pubescens TaxID=118200 RepID=UPI0023B900D0|nr:uncharacterized protein LOC128898245 [Dryobates pubescens]
MYCTCVDIHRHTHSAGPYSDASRAMPAAAEEAEPMARKEPLLSVLKGKLGRPGAGTRFLRQLSPGDRPLVAPTAGPVRGLPWQGQSRRLPECGVLRLREVGGPCTDTSPHLASLCQLLENILRKGLRQPAWGFRRRDYWHWLEQLPTGGTGRPSPLSISVQQAGGCEKVQTAQGRGRYFLRLALQEKVLAVAIRELAQTPKLLEVQHVVGSQYPWFYDPASSILGNEELLEPFLSLLLVLTEMDFSLDLQNCSFLDESWLLPVCITYEMVPCHTLGMVLRYVDGRVFVTEVLPGSQAEVDEVVLAGDILDEINGCSLRNAHSGQAGAVLQKLKGQPLSLRLLRWQWHDGEVYEPLLPYLKVLKQKEPRFQLQRSPRRRGKEEPQQLQGGRLLYKLRYLGQTSVGKYGGKEVLARAIPAVLERHSPVQHLCSQIGKVH